MDAPTCIETDRLILRKPEAADAQAVFGYAGDPEVGKYLGWPIHKSVEDTEAFLTFSDAQWDEWPAGPYLIIARGSAAIIGSTGLAFESADEASTGYVIAKDHWGNGFATEATRAMCELAPGLGITRLFALCHPDHRASQRVLEKSGFQREESPAECEFPNLRKGQPATALCYVRHFKRGAG